MGGLGCVPAAAVLLLLVLVVGLPELLVRTDVVPLREGMEEEELVPLRATPQQGPGEDVAGDLGDLDGQRQSVQLVDALERCVLSILAS